MGHHRFGREKINLYSCSLSEMHEMSREEEKVNKSEKYSGSVQATENPPVHLYI